MKTLKRLNAIKDAASLVKTDQITLNGGIQPIATECAVICPTAPNGTFCYNGGSHCPGECNGRGGWNSY